MAHKIECHCGKTLKVPDRFAGRKIRCVTCGQVLRLGSHTLQQERGVFREASVTCQRCSTQYPAMTRICLPCGVNLQTGAVVYTPGDISSEELDWSSEENLVQRPEMLQKLFKHLLDP